MGGPSDPPTSARVMQTEFYSLDANGVGQPWQIYRAKHSFFFNSMSPITLQVRSKLKISTSGICECSLSMTGSCLTYQNRRNSGQTSRKCIITRCGLRKVLWGIESVIGTFEVKAKSRRYFQKSPIGHVPHVYLHANFGHRIGIPCPLDSARRFSALYGESHVKFMSNNVKFQIW